MNHARNILWAGLLATVAIVGLWEATGGTLVGNHKPDSQMASRYPLRSRTPDFFARSKGPMSTPAMNPSLGRR